MNITLSFASVISIFTTLVTCNLGKKESLPVVATDTISNQSEKMSIAQMFRENGHLPMEERIEHFYELKKEHPNTYDFENEDALNFYGYQLLWNNEDQDAFLIFKLIVSEFQPTNAAFPYFAALLRTVRCQ